MTVTLGSLVLGVINNVSLAALVAVGYAVLRRSVKGDLPLAGLPLGILFGIGGVLALVFRIAPMPGVFADARNVMIALSALFGGPIAGTVTAVMTVAYRLYLGGAGVAASVASAVGALLFGLLFHRLRREGRFRIGPVSLLAFGVALVAIGAAPVALMIPFATLGVAITFVASLLLIVPISTVSVGLTLQAEEDRERLEITLETRTAELAESLANVTTAKTLAERSGVEAQHALQLLRAITDAVPVPVIYMDKDVRYTYYNKAYGELMGADAEKWIGRRAADVLGPEVWEPARPHIDLVLSGRPAVFLRPLTGKDRTRYLELRYLPAVDADGKVAGFYGVGWDITEHHDREQVLDTEASTDPLTGLMNRRAMVAAIADAARGWSPAGSGGAVLFLDIDKFKRINDTLGHDAGDQLLKVFGERIAAEVRATDRVARFGGDEFVILITAQNAQQVATRVATTLLENVRKPVQLGNHLLEITTSIGIAICPGGVQSPDQLLKEADLALYDSKAAGRDRYTLRHLRA